MRGLARPAMRDHTGPPASQRRPVYWRLAGQSVGRARTRAQDEVSFAFSRQVIRLLRSRES